MPSAGGFSIATPTISSIARTDNSFSRGSIPPQQFGFKIPSVLTIPDFIDLSCLHLIKNHINLISGYPIHYNV